MPFLSCPYLGSQVALTDERMKHIVERHPDMLPRCYELIAGTLEDPDRVRRSLRCSDACLFARWFDSLPGGKYVVVVVITEKAERTRHWIVTAYRTQNLTAGETEWTRN
ncbi:MAG TPA: PBECR2 nuclease fold domain-containing protein [bacterium]|nr:PBECR2 nuclease fold domain-containing protein [bacterium]HQL62916.1 PBECR2 nuclease fold domain-containing protein [bacterium]